jgi:hypothetical protein
MDAQQKVIDEKQAEVTAAQAPLTAAEGEETAAKGDYDESVVELAAKRTAFYGEDGKHHPELQHKIWINSPDLSAYNGEGADGLIANSKLPLDWHTFTLEYAGQYENLMYTTNGTIKQLNVKALNATYHTD